MRLLTKFCAITSALTLSGCASTWNVGESQYSCPGMPSGVICKTPLEVYKLTNNRAALVTMDSNGKKAVIGDAGEESLNPAVVQQVHLPTPIQQPMPVMEAAKVMRIWIAPWIDQAGDLHYPSFIFSEVTPRRWSIGNLVKGQNARVPVSSYIEPSRDDAGAVADKVLPMAPAGIAPPLPDRKPSEDESKRARSQPVQNSRNSKTSSPFNNLFNQK